MFVIKFQHEDDIRRITVERCLPIQELIELARSLFRENIPQHFVLKYKDDEGDFVTITSDRELEEAFRLFKDAGILRLHVSQIEAPKLAHSPAPAPAPQQQKTSPLDDIVNTFSPFVEAMENEFKGVWPKLEQGCNEIYPKIEERLKGFGETAFDALTQVFDSNKKAETKPTEAVIHPAICDNCQERITGLNGNVSIAPITISAPLANNRMCMRNTQITNSSNWRELCSRELHEDLARDPLLPLQRWHQSRKRLRSLCTLSPLL